MKKYKIIKQIVILVIVILSFSCASNKKVCPAYSMNNTTVVINKS